VVIPAYRARDTIARVMQALEPQILGAGREVVIVESGSADTGAWLRSRWPWARVLSIEQRLLPGQARNRGASIAEGDRLAFLDADAVPQPGWLDELELALGPGVEIVAGAVLNGTPASIWGTIAYLLEFLDWDPDGPGAPWHAAGCNLLLERAALERMGGFPEDLWPGEDTVLSAPLARSGVLAFAPRACVAHLNRKHWRTVLAHQRRLGAAWVAICERETVPGTRLLKPPVATWTGAGRVLAVMRQLRSYPDAVRRFVPRAPLLLLGILAWSFGVAQYSRSKGPRTHDDFGHPHQDLRRTNRL